MSEYGVFSEYGDLLVNLRIQSEYREIRTRKNSVFGHFSRSEDGNVKLRWQQIYPKKQG